MKARHPLRRIQLQMRTSPRQWIVKNWPSLPISYRDSTTVSNNCRHQRTFLSNHDATRTVAGCHRHHLSRNGQNGHQHGNSRHCDRLYYSNLFRSYHIPSRASNSKYSNVSKRCLCSFRSAERPSEQSVDHPLEQVAVPGVIRQSDIFGEAVTFVQSGAAAVAAEASVDKSVSDHGNIMIDALSCYDNAAVCILSKGGANIHEGNDGEGPVIKAMHSSSLAWAPLLEYAWEWNGGVIGTSSDGDDISVAAPMLAVAAVAPALAQGGVSYVHRIDKLLSSSSDGRDQSSEKKIEIIEGKRASKKIRPPCLLDMANYAVQFRDKFVSMNPNDSSGNGQLACSEDIRKIPLLTPRERWHLHALYHLCNNDHVLAMGAYLKLLELYPADLLGLSLAIDVAYSLGDSDSALRAATNVSTFWAERDGGRLQLTPTNPGQTLSTSLVAVGLSAPSNNSTAERLAENALSRDSQGAGGMAIWALSQCLGSEGRSSEMVSKLSGFDGTQHYEGCGYLGFHARMGGYSALALLDHMGSSAERSALRLYDGGFGFVLGYSGNDVQGRREMGGEEACLAEKRIPASVRSNVTGAVGSMFSNLFGGGTENKRSDGDDFYDGSTNNDHQKTGNKVKQLKRTPEDVLCWLPPSPLLLTNATALLFRLTLYNAILPNDHRWLDLAVAWEIALKPIDNDASSFSSASSPQFRESQSNIEFMPLAMVAASLLIEPDKITKHKIPPRLSHLMYGLNKMAKIMKIGQENSSSFTTESTSNKDSPTAETWKEVLRHLTQARDSCQRWEMPNGLSLSSTYLPPSSLLVNENASSTSAPTSAHCPVGWEFDARQFLEYAICHAAVQAGDYESLCLARAICSEGTTLRSNCPELWMRYASILDLLGDHVSAENARAASVSLGSGG